MVEIRMNHIYKQYPGNEEYSVSDFDLDIQDKEFIVLVGPSGCGKSTALRMIAGLEDITAGSLEIDGERMNDVPPKDRGIAMVFQNYALYPHMTVHDNMSFALKLRKYDKAKIDDRVNEAAEILDIKDYLDRKPAALSGGQRQRVALGRAIVRDAKVFLMDEPLSNLDAKLRVQMRSEISKLHKRLDTTMIYVTHDQIEAMTMATRIVVMKKGVIQQIGAPLDVYNHPHNMFVAGFIGSPPMNFFHVVYDHGHVRGGNNLNLKLAEADAKRLDSAGYEKKHIVIGVRPEDLRFEQIYFDTFQDTRVDAKLEVDELLGSDALLHLRKGEDQFIAKINARELTDLSEDVEFVIDPTKIHFFDVDSEQAIFVK